MTLKNTPISLIVNFILVFFLTFFLGILGIYNYAGTRASMEETLNQSTSNAVERLQLNLSGALWNIDIELAIPVLSSEISDQNIKGIAVWEGVEKQSFFAGITRDKNWKPVPVRKDWSAPDHGQPIVADILKGDKKLGTLEVYTTDRFLKERLNALMWQTILAVLLIDCIMLTGIYLAFRKVLVVPLNKLEILASKAGNGDLACSEPAGLFCGELATLRTTLVQMICNLSETIAEVRQKEQEAQDNAQKAEHQRKQAEIAREEAFRSRKEGMVQAADTLEDMVRRITSFTQELAHQVDGVKDGTEQQRRSITGAVASLNEMNSTVMEVAKSSHQASEQAQETSSQATTGHDVVNESVLAIRTVNDRALELEANMQRLQGKAGDIGSVINVINDIADQTNLLALNAAIEAARAGEAGRGFAVVADEVRKLAEKTMSATKDVSRSITDIQKETNRSLNITGDVAKAVLQATELSSHTSESLDGIRQVAAVTSDQIRHIAAAAEEQSVAAEEIASSVEEINRVARENADGMNEAVSALDELTGLTTSLNRLVSDLKNT